MEVEENRITKLQALQNRGIDPYPNSFVRRNTIASILQKNFSDHLVETEVVTAGRVIHKRSMGKAGFVHIRDQSSQIQIYSNNKILSEQEYFIFQQLDIGDIIGVTAIPFYTKTKEPSLRVAKLVLLSKNLTTLPIVKEKEGVVYDAFKDTETRYRKRYIDLTVNPSVSNVFRTRSKIIQTIRNFLLKNDFLEVETPMLQSTASGASAKPFVTHHNTLKMSLYMRISPELALKRLIVGGFEKVFEVNRNFRNEGMSTNHNPEFTMLELYQAYADYNTMLHLTEDIFTHICQNVTKSDTIPYMEHKINIKKSWPCKKYFDVIQEETDLDFSSFAKQDNPDLEEAKEMVKSKSLSIDLENIHTFWEVVDAVFSNYVEGKLIQPIFITHYPKAISPLAKACQNEPYLVERFEPYIAGREMGNAFSELNDPIEQEKRFQMQKKLQQEGAKEIVEMDEDFLEALKVGMPPTGGLGLGIDRITMLFTNQPSIKDVILFPTMRVRSL